MRIYVGTYAKYNRGNLSGQWLDLEDYSDKEEFLEACKELHKDESDPEFMFQDWEGIPESMVGESWVAEEAFEMAQASEGDREIWSNYRDHVNQDASLEDALEAYYGTYDSPADFAESLADETGDLENVPEFYRNHIDWESVAREYKISGDFVFVSYEGNTWVYRSN